MKKLLTSQSTALLLARLEQENNLLATNPKSGIAKVQIIEKQNHRSMSRPPSIQQERIVQTAEHTAVEETG